jgi:uncharacterized phiE125 gp8 family phage protein
MTHKLITPPVSEPVSATEVKDQLRLDSDDELLLLESYIRGARQHVESLCGPLITQTWELYLDSWPAGGVIDLGKPRGVSVTSVKYKDSAGVEATFASSNYVVDVADAWCPRIILKETSSWPSATLYNVRPITVRFVCGYGTASDVPEPIRIAITMLCAQWHAQREPTTALSVNLVPWAVDALLAEYRVY